MSSASLVGRHRACGQVIGHIQAGRHMDDAGDPVGHGHLHQLRMGRDWLRMGYLATGHGTDAVTGDIVKASLGSAEGFRQRCTHHCARLSRQVNSYSSAPAGIGSVTIQARTLPG